MRDRAIETFRMFGTPNRPQVVIAQGGRPTDADPSTEWDNCAFVLCASTAAKSLTTRPNCNYDRYFRGGTSTRQ